MRILSVVHSEHAKTELFAPGARAAGHTLDEWGFGSGTRPPAPLDSYDAFMVFGGSMHADEDALHPWLARETAWLEGLLEDGVPVLGVCLGAQLLARAAGAWGGPLDGGPEIGWHDVELTETGRSDPVLGVLPASFDALEWHHYTYEVPDDAVELARSARCTQAFRLGEACWAVQFHPEVTHAQMLGWIEDRDEPPVEPERLRDETALKIERWNELGIGLCNAFLAAAERTLARAA